MTMYTTDEFALALARCSHVVAERLFKELLDANPESSRIAARLLKEGYRVEIRVVWDVAGEAPITVELGLRSDLDDYTPLRRMVHRRGDSQFKRSGVDDT